MLKIGGGGNPKIATSVGTLKIWGVLTPKSPHDVDAPENSRCASRAGNRGGGGFFPRNGKTGLRAQNKGVGVLTPNRGGMSLKSPPQISGHLDYLIVVFQNSWGLTTYLGDELFRCKESLGAHGPGIL